MIALTGGTVVESWAGGDVRPDTTVLVDDSGIVALGRGVPPQGAEIIDCEGCLVAPGLVCAHTHAYHALARGMPGPADPTTSFQEILEKIWWRLDRALDPAAITSSGTMSAVEALLSGTTTIFDHHSSPSSIDGSLGLLADAFGRAGLRAALCYEVTDRHGRPGRDAGLRESERFLRKLAEPGAPALLRGLVGAHAGFTLTSESLEACADLARRLGTGVHLSVAEDHVDREHDGQPIVQRLDELGVLTERTLVAHAVHVDEVGAGALRRRRCFVAHNPRSNMNHGVGYARPRRFGERLVLGTAGIGADLFEEARFAYYRLREHDVDASPDDVLAWVARGAELASEVWEQRIGTIEPGAAADLVVLDYRAPTPVTRRNLAGHFLFGLCASHVRDVVVGGRAAVRDRQVLGVAVPDAYTAARAAAESLWSRMDALA